MGGSETATMKGAEINATYLDPNGRRRRRITTPDQTGSAA